MQCSGIVYSPTTDQHSDRVNVLFRLDRTLDVPLRPICTQSPYGITPKFNIFCAS